MCCAPVRSLTGSTQEHFIPMEKPGGVMGRPQGAKHHSSRSTPHRDPDRGDPSPLGTPLAVSASGNGEDSEGIRAQDTTALLSPPTPALDAPEHPNSPSSSFSASSSSQQQTLGCGRGLGFSDGLCILEELCSASLRWKVPRWMFRSFWGLLTIKPCEGLKTNQHWLSQRGSWLLRMDPSSKQDPGKWE